MKQPKQTLRSIKDVYSRLKWDGSIDTATIFIGYLDRSRGLVEMPFADFRPGGRVPWDRIQYFRMGDVRIWDRLSRIDLVFGSGETPANATLIVDSSSEDTEAATFGSGWPRSRATQWQPEDGTWSATHERSAHGNPKWKILSLNLLSNGLLPGRPQDLQRYQALLDFLRQQDADVIALQEADKYFLKLLQQQSWAQAQYFIADNAGIGQERSHFELLLTKQAPQTVVVPLIADECRAILAQIINKGQRVSFVCLHLFSDSGSNAATKREEFLHQLSAQSPVDEPVVLLGDFNFGDEYESPALREFSDGWLQLRPGEAGITYDGPNNVLAQLGNPRSRARRIDRFFLRHEARFPFVETIDVLPVLHPETQAPLSDHHALVATMSFGGSFGTLRSAPKTNKSALCIIPPAGLWLEIQALRRRYDTSFTRWMPHINMVYGFIPQYYFPEAASALKAALADAEPILLRLEGFDTFEHADSTTIYLKPDAASVEKLRELQTIANAIFPQCNDAERHGVFNPHLTVAKIPHSRKKEVRRLLQEWNALWEPVSFTVDALSMIARSDVSAFEVLETVSIGSQNAEDKLAVDLRTTLGAMGLLAGKMATEERNIALQKVQRGIRNIGNELCLLPVGSTALGTMLPGSDLDFVCLGRMSVDEFLALAPKHMEGMQFARVANNALVPALKLYFPGYSADVSYVQLADEFPLESPEKWSRQLMARLDAAQARALRACTDAAMLLERAGAMRDAYRIATTALKAWAEANGLKGNAFGYPGGFAWSLMLAQAGPHTTPEAWLKAFFEDFVHREWAGAVPGEAPAPMLLLSGETPPFNITRNVSANTLAILQSAAEEALLRIWAIEEGESTWAEWFAPVKIPAIAEVVLRWQAPTRLDLEVCGGWLLSQIFGLVQRVEGIAGLRSRPDAVFTEGPKLSQEYRIALLSYPDDAQTERLHDLLSALEEAFSCLQARPSGATLRSAIEFVALDSPEIMNFESYD